MTTTTQTKPWTHRKVDGWWCVYDSTGALSAKFILEGECLNYLSMARIGRIPQHCSACATTIAAGGA